jgi:NDP-sugar pyrophosphorylase family protein
MKIIIPMSGIGKRFIEKGYTIPKPLIIVDGMPIIQHVINLFPNETEFYFICNDQHLKETNMREILEKLCPTGKIFQVSVNDRKGPVDAVLQIINHLDLNDNYIVSYCDYGTWWDYNKFLGSVKDYDGCIPCYTGFHPHMLGNDNYAFCKEKDKILEHIQEKKPFTDNKMNEYASNGTYYFKNGHIIKKYFQELVDLNIQINGEFYVSCVYNLMIRDRLKTLIFEIDNMLQWGTPYDLECYNMWSNYFGDSINEMKLEYIDNCITLLPMAGKGSRFSMQGYKDPKPLLQVNNNPMIIEAVNCLPQTNKTYFIGLKEHYEKYPIQEQIEKYIPNSDFLLIDETTNGQATTCKLAIDYFNIKNKSIIISACDNGAYYNCNKFKNLIQNGADIIVWSFTNNPTSLLYPNMYAWLDIDKNNNIKRVSVKKKFNDSNTKHCIIGTMYFKDVEYFNQGYKYIVDNNIKTNNEYYVDDLLNYLIQLGLNVKVFEVDYYLCWGTPNDYKTFIYWQSFFNKCNWHPYKNKLI